MHKQSYLYFTARLMLLQERLTGEIHSKYLCSEIINLCAALKFNTAFVSTITVIRLRYLQP